MLKEKNKFTRLESFIEGKPRAATATKASKARALPKFWVTINPISTRGADYAHHSTMGLVWLKFAVAPLHLYLQ